MTIQNLARELIEVKTRVEEAECEYTRKRDEMLNALANQPNNSFEQDGFRFIRRENQTVLTVTKETVLEALRAENLPREVLDRIIGAALVESERWGGLRIIRSRR